jgi:hypothetical protein
MRVADDNGSIPGHVHEALEPSSSPEVLSPILESVPSDSVGHEHFTGRLKDEDTSAGHNAIAKTEPRTIAETLMRAECLPAEMDTQPGTGTRAHDQNSPVKSSQKVLKLSPDKLYELTTSPDAVPIYVQEIDKDVPELPLKQEEGTSALQSLEREQWQARREKPGHNRMRSGSEAGPSNLANNKALRSPVSNSNLKSEDRPSFGSRAMSTPLLKRKQSSNRPANVTPLALKIGKSSGSEEKSARKDTATRSLDPALPSPMPSTIPLPPMSVPTYLQLELSSSRPSPLYIHRSSYADFPYESSTMSLVWCICLPRCLAVYIYSSSPTLRESFVFAHTISVFQLGGRAQILGVVHLFWAWTCVATQTFRFNCSSCAT